MPDPPLPVANAPTSKPRSCFRRGGTTSSKKRVVFADAMGLALAAVRLFIPETSSPNPALLTKAVPAKLQSQQVFSGVQEQQQQQPSPQQQPQQRYKPRLSFPPPMIDFKGFLARLRETGVQLQSCSVSEQSLTGNVSVSQVGGNNAVTIRVTFDSWKSHHDVPCTFLQRSPFGGSDIDVFTFSLCLPKSLDPKDQVEFCVRVSPGPGLTPLVDDNMGQNYRLCLDRDVPITTHCDVGRFYPTLTSHLYRPSPLSASVGKQGFGELSYFQRSLLSRVGGEGIAGDWPRVYPTFALG